jgi:amino acid adenylation domain-containing protein
MGSHTQQMACLILGEGTLPRRCGELLLERGHRIAGLVSPDDSLRAWATERGIRCAGASLDLPEFCRQEPFDVLFSISNSLILPRGLLALPRRAAINYHDGPLPRYAGTHATSWALVNGETAHAVTWHLMCERVDAGDLLKQPRIEITAGETALTLNAKCYEAAAHSFSELVEELAADRVRPRPQDLSHRTFFPRRRRFPAGGVLDWERPAHEIDALVRSLDFGPFPNPLGRPKLLLGSEALIVPEVVLLTDRTAVPPGTITGIQDDSFTVAAADGAVEIRKLLTLAGQPLPVAEAKARHGLREGRRLDVLDPERSSRITQVSEQIGEYEPFWLERLARLQPIVLPSVQRLTSTADPRSPGRLSMAIPEPVRAALESWGGGGSAGDALVTAFVAFLARLTGETCFDIGYGDVARHRDLEGMEGLFALHVPMHVAIDMSAPLSEIHSRLQEEMARVRRHGTYALDLEARYPVLRGQAGPDGRRAFPVVVQHGPRSGEPAKAAGSDLALVIHEDGSACDWRYEGGSLDEAGIAGMARQFTMFLRAAAAVPEQPVAHLPLLSNEERYQLLVTFNDTAAEYPRHRNVLELFEEQVARTPQAIAVRFEGRCLTYEELNRRANRLARQLQALGVGPEVLVGLCMERSLELVVGLLGILKAGGAWVPLDPEYPRERLAFMLSDAGVPVVLTQERLRAALSPCEALLLCLDTDQSATPPAVTGAPTSGVTPQNLAYVIYTSGSTGQPKGVMISHQSLCNHLCWRRSYFPLTEADRLLMLSSISFDDSVWQFFEPLISGAQLVLPRPGGHRDPAYLVRLITEERITAMTFVPSLMEAFLDEPGAERCRSLRRVTTGGESLRAELQERFFACLDADLHNLYGPTESTVSATVWTCRRNSDTRTVPIGCPLANMRVYVLDPQMQLVPIGVPGELYIGGDGLARGYLNRPDLTAERFVLVEGSWAMVEGPNGPVPGPPTTQRLYRTGDLGRYKPDGAIEFLGRTDSQVKVRGFRIELEEIETVLGQHPGVRAAAVLAREDEPGQKRLVAYWVAHRDPETSAADLRSFLQEQLPAQMVPAHFVSMDAMPLTPSGKVDRRSLPAPDGARSGRSAAPVPPRTPLERMLAEIWSGLLSIEGMGIEDNFFELGGDSLLATRCMARLHRELQVTLPLQYLFESPTIAGLALAIAERLAQEVDAEAMTGLIGALAESGLPSAPGRHGAQ